MGRGRDADGHAALRRERNRLDGRRRRRIGCAAAKRQLWRDVEAGHDRERTVARRRCNGGQWRRRLSPVRAGRSPREQGRSGLEANPERTQAARVASAVDRAANQQRLAAGEWADGAEGNGPILRSTDGGATFTKTKSDSTGPIIDLAFRDSLIGVAVGANGAALRTTDGGATWTKVSIDTKRNLAPRGVRRQRHGRGIGAFSRGDVEGPGIFRSTDAGRTLGAMRHVDDGLLFGLAFRGPKFGLAAERLDTCC